MNPGRSPKRNYPMPQRHAEDHNLTDKHILRDKAFFDPRTHETVAAILRATRQNPAPAPHAHETPLQQFGVIVAAARLRAGLTRTQLAARAHLAPDALAAIELGAANFTLISEAVTPLSHALHNPTLPTTLATLLLTQT